MSSKRTALIERRTQVHRDAAARATDGFVRTPVKLADEIVSGHRDIGALPRGARVLEPSAGDGPIVRAILDNDRDAHVVAIEPNDGRADALDAIPGERDEYAGRVTVVRSQFEAYAAAYTGELFDAAALNPPWSDSSRDLVWIDHVRAAWELLRPGGVLVAIVPPSYAFRTDRAHSEFRTWVEGCGGRFEKLAGQPFAESGTGVSAGVLTVPRPMPARPDGLPGWLFRPAAGVPVPVPGLPVVTSVGALTMPVQEYDDRWDGSRPRVIRYAGECYGCRRCVWQHDDRTDAAGWEACTLEASEHGQAGPSVALCLECYSNGDPVWADALRAVAPYWSPAPDGADNDGPAVYPLDLAAGNWATVRGPNRDGEVSTLTGRLMADPEPAGHVGGVAFPDDRVTVRLRTAGGRDMELYPLHDQRVIVRDVPADVVPTPAEASAPALPAAPAEVPAPAVESWTLQGLMPGSVPANRFAWRPARVFDGPLSVFDPAARTPEAYTDRAAATLAAVALAESGRVHGVELRNAAGEMRAQWHASDGLWREWGRLDDRGWVDRALTAYAAAQEPPAVEPEPAGNDQADADPDGFVSDWGQLMLQF
jgi:hypothetical protein